MGLNRSGLNTTAYLGVEAPTPPQFEMHPRSPTTRDYQNFNVGTLWLDTSSLKDSPSTIPMVSDLYLLVAKINKSASWIKFDASNLDTLTGDTGGAVPPDGAANINVLGTTDHITTTGDIGTSTITLDIGDLIADTYVTDVGNASPAANVLNILGGTGVDTAGATDTVTINAGDDVPVLFTSDSGTATPASNNLDVLGGTSISTSGATDTLTIALDGDVATTYTSDSGNATPAANVLNVLGGTGVDTAGATDTVTINAGDNVPILFTSDSGTATPASNNLAVLGGTSISTSGATDTLTIALDGDVATTYTSDSGTATPAANNINIVGGSGISTSAAGSTVTVTHTGPGTTSAFFATLTATDSNVIGNITFYQVPFDTTVFDINSDFDTVNNYFVAPYDGIYFFKANVAMSGITSAMDNGEIAIVVNSGPPTYPHCLGNNWNYVPIINGTQFDIAMSAYFSLSAGDTVKTVVSLNGAVSDTADIIISGTAKDYITWFQGSLVTTI